MDKTRDQFHLEILEWVNLHLVAIRENRVRNGPVFYCYFLSVFFNILDQNEVKIRR